MRISRIDFIKSTDIVSGTVTYTTSSVFNPVLSAEETGTSFNILASKPRTLSFTLNLGASFFVDFVKSANTIGEYSLYFIRAYDNNDNHVYSGLIKRNEYRQNDEENKIDITAKDFSTLLSDLKSLSLAQTDIVSNNLDQIEDAYTYYIDTAATRYFTIASQLSRDLSKLLNTYQLGSLSYQNKNIKLIDIINIFTSANIHIFRVNLETIYVEDAEYNNFTPAEIVIPESDIIDLKQTALTTSRLNPSIVTNNIDDTGTYQDDVLNIINLSYNRFVDSIDTKLVFGLSSILNTYNPVINQIVSINSIKYVIKKINQVGNIYNLNVWNSKNPPTDSNIIHIGSSLFRTWTNDPTNDIIHIGSTLRNDNTDNIIHIGSDKINDTTNDIVHIGSDERNDNTDNIIQVGFDERNENTDNILHAGTDKRNDNNNEILHISDD